MTEKPKVIFVKEYPGSSDEWPGLYINGKIASQGDECPGQYDVVHLYKLIGIDVEVQFPKIQLLDYWPETYEELLAMEAASNTHH